MLKQKTMNTITLLARESSSNFQAPKSKWNTGKWTNGLDTYPSTSISFPATEHSFRKSTRIFRFKRVKGIALRVLYFWYHSRRSVCIFRKREKVLALYCVGLRSKHWKWNTLAPNLNIANWGLVLNLSLYFSQIICFYLSIILMNVVNWWLKFIFTFLIPFFLFFGEERQFGSRAFSSRHLVPLVP